jgi:hypothetical protein
VNEYSPQQIPRLAAAALKNAREEEAALKGWGTCNAALFGIEKKSENSKNEHK